MEGGGGKAACLDVVPSLALVVKPVDAVNGSALVVAAQDEEVLGVLDLVG
jgi:hypothetical protein